MLNLACFVFLSCLSSQALAASVIDQSHQIFFPKQTAKHLSVTNDFSHFWWNFLIFEAKDQAEASQASTEICNALAKLPEGSLAKSTCINKPSLFLPILKDWASHLSLRKPQPSNINEKLMLSEAWLSMAGTNELVPILRLDPLQSFEDLIKMLTAGQSLPFEQVGGAFYDPQRKLGLLALQFGFAPSQTEKFAKLTTLLEPLQLKVRMIGPHWSTWENELQVRQDLGWISKVGFVVLFLQIALIFFFGRLRLLWLFPPVAISVALAGLVTVCVFGSIHALTLAFGVGLIGLGLDFGLHSCFNLRWSRVWQANLFGLLTTLAAFIIVGFSQVPLLRQMMFFAAVGLIFCFLLFHFLHSHFPQSFEVKAFPMTPKSNKLSSSLAILTPIFAIGLVFVKPQLGLQNFNYQGEQTKQDYSWFYHALGPIQPLFSLFESQEGILRFAHRQKDQADQIGIKLSSLASFVPRLSEQERNLATWASCSQKVKADSALWTPFFSNLRCQSLTGEELRYSAPAYLSDYFSSGRWMTVWYPRDLAQSQSIQEHYPDSFSLAQVVQQFSEDLNQEMLWMVPISLGIALAFLLIYFRTFSLSLLALVPFISGMGLYCLLSWVFGLPTSFVSIIALIMIFGLSIDYGIFATNLFDRRYASDASTDGVWTCLWLAALVTILGFAPLLFAKHPVLIHLGFTLTVGTLGTLIGTLWGVPLFARFLAPVAEQK